MLFEKLCYLNVSQKNVTATKVNLFKKIFQAFC